MDAESYKPIYDEVRAAVNYQRAERSELRAAAGRVFGIGVLATSVVGGFKTTSDGLTWWEVAPIAALLVLAVYLVAAIWWPRKGWRFDPDAKTAIETMLEGREKPMTAAAVYGLRAKHLQEDWETNRKMLKPFYSKYRWLLAVEAALVIVLVVSSM